MTENQLMSESVPAGKVQNNDIGDMQKVKGKGEMYFKQNPGGKDKGMSPSMKSKQMNPLYFSTKLQVQFGLTCGTAKNLIFF